MATTDLVDIETGEKHWAYLSLDSEACDRVRTIADTVATALPDTPPHLEWEQSDEPHITIIPGINGFDYPFKAHALYEQLQPFTTASIEANGLRFYRTEDYAVISMDVDIEDGDELRDQAVQAVRNSGKKVDEITPFHITLFRCHATRGYDQTGMHRGKQLLNQQTKTALRDTVADANIATEFPITPAGVHIEQW